ncbi:T9SS type A sorting domain-containing protein [Flavobacterium haoranii]|uniref:Por secretion system C-terminal sorting domain-containing protein n=1 Tax=Flavobacterium haoranii TaxID=683124 RepID=A0A1M6FNP5_9FLAO|nr:T9SS type A sorting domain-containing protein [Flavobacterium haoranii]SHI99296.1 Por secretion system C-terminal sorting domain-containing protein [Flavobacterium haoranii]
MKIKLLLFLLIGTFSRAQDWQWIKEGGGTGTADTYTQEQVYSMVTDSQNNIYILSRVRGSDVEIDGNSKATYGYSTPSDVVLASFSCNGTYRWSKIIGGNGTENINAVQVDSQDNVYVAGNVATCNGGGAGNFYYARIDDEYEFINTDSACTLIFLAKFDTNGIIQYVKRPQLPTTPSLAGAYTASYNVEIHNDIIYWSVWLPPGIYADGAFTNSNPDPETPYVLKYYPDGTFMEAIQLGTVQNNYPVVANYYRNPYNGYFYMTYRKVNSGGTFSINGLSIVNSAALICYDNLGQYQWKIENTNSTASAMRFYGVDFDSSNNIYLSGRIAPFNYDSILGYSNSAGGSYPYIMKINSTGTNYIWATKSNTNANDFGAIKYNGGEIAYTGWGFGTNFTWGSQTINITNTNEGQDVLFARFDSTTGNCLSLNKINSDVGSTDFGNAIAVDASGDYIVGGGFGHYIYDMNNNVSTNEGGPSDFFLAKFSTQACTPLSNESFDESQIRIYPNPANEFITVSVTENTKYELYNVTGQLVKIGSLSVNENSINIQELSKGCYLLKLKSENKLLKILKQ